MSNNKPFVLLVQDRLNVEPGEGDFLPPLEFATLAEAIDAAQAVIDDYMQADFAKNPNDRPLQLLDSLLDFGYMPYVTGPGVSILDFNPRAWAELRCYEIAGKTEDYSGKPITPTGRPLPRMAESAKNPAAWADLSDEGERDASLTLLRSVAESVKSNSNR